MKKAIGGEANNLQAALDLLQKPVPNIIKTPEEKEMPKLIGEGGILFDYTDPVDVGLTALGFTGVGTATALSIKAARLAAKLKKLEAFKNIPLYHGGFLPSKNALKIKGVDVFYASPSYKIAERYNPVNPENIKLTGKTPKELYKTNRQPGVFEMQPPNKFAVLDKPDKAFKKDVKDYLGDLKSQQKQIIKDNKDYAIKNYGNRPDFNPTNKYYLPTNKLDDLRNLDFKVKDLTRYLKNPKKYDTTAGLGYGYKTGSGVLDALKAKNYDAVLTNQAFTRLSSPKSKFKKIDEAEIASDQVVFLKPMGAKKVSTKQLKKEFEDLSREDFLQNPPDWWVKKATGGEVTNLQAALNMLQNPVTSSISPLGDPTLSPLMESLQKNPIDDFAMMMASPVKKVTSAARLAQLANPTDEVFETVTRKELLDYIKTIPLKERLALRANDSIPLNGKYAILDSDKIDFYKDIVDLGKLPKNFKAGDNTLAKIYMEKNNIPSRVDITEPLAGFKPRPYFEEIIDFKKGTEKIKLSFPKTGVLQPYGAQTAYRTKTLTNPSKEQLDKLFKGMREKDLQKQLDGLRKAKSIESDPGSTLGDLAEATKLKQNASFKTSDDIAKELLELQGEGLLDTDLLAILRKQYNL
jgi:ribosomal protein L13